MMNSKFITPAIVFITLFIVIIVILIILRNKRKSKYKNEISDLEYAKNKLIDAHLLTELSKVRELVKTDDLKQKLADWDETVRVIKEDKIDVLTDLITEADSKYHFSDRDEIERLEEWGNQLRADRQANIDNKELQTVFIFKLYKNKK